MQIASFMTNSMACCSILVSSQIVQACSAMVDLQAFTPSLDLSAGAQYFVLRSRTREGVLGLSEERTEGGSGLEHCSEIEVLTHPPDPLTHARHVREVDSGWPILLPFPVMLPQRLGSRGRTDEGTRITIPHEGFHEVVLLLPEALSLLHDAPGTVVKTPYRTPLHMCWMVRQVPVRVRLFTVHSNVQEGTHTGHTTS